MVCVSKMFPFITKVTEDVVSYDNKFIFLEFIKQVWYKYFFI